MWWTTFILDRIIEASTALRRSDRSEMMMFRRG